MNNIIEFCKKYKEKLINDKDILEKKINFLYDCRPRINFRLCYEENYRNLSYFRLNNCYISLITLDEEDLQYFYNKYQKKLEEERNKKIDKIKEEYKIQ